MRSHIKDIKFEYIYRNNSDAFIKDVFNLQEVEQAFPVDVICDSPLLRDYKIIARRQYTGLKDKNGKEIYEGDLVQLYDNKNGCFRVEFVNDYVGGWVLTHPSTDSHVSLGARKPTAVSVVGNIYENPDLLND